jgi:hypothetical protein
MLASIVLSVLLHLPGQIEPGEPHLIPGKIEVTYHRGVTSEERRAFEKSVGLPEPTLESLKAGGPSLRGWFMQGWVFSSCLLPDY